MSSLGTAEASALTPSVSTTKLVSKSSLTSSLAAKAPPPEPPSMIALLAALDAMVGTAPTIKAAAAKACECAKVRRQFASHAVLAGIELSNGIKLFHLLARFIYNLILIICVLLFVPSGAFCPQGPQDHPDPSEACGRSGRSAPGRSDDQISFDGRGSPEK